MLGENRAFSLAVVSDLLRSTVDPDLLKYSHAHACRHTHVCALHMHVTGKNIDMPIKTK